MSLYGKPESNRVEKSQETPYRPSALDQSSPSRTSKNLFEGTQDVSLPAYQLFLTKRFAIEKNITLDKYVVGNEVFDDLAAVLAYADDRYSKQLAEIENDALRHKLELEALEQERSAAAKRAQAETEDRAAREEVLRIESVALAKQQREARNKSIRKAMPFGIATAVLALAAVGWQHRQQTIQEEATRIAWQTPGKVIKDCADCPELVEIPAGSFEMGARNSDSPDELPLHKVKVQRFLLGRTEVTQGQWLSVMGSNPSNFSKCGDNCPVEGISWDDAQSFVSKLSQKTGKSYRLPSEAEWEYAARSAGNSKWGFGSDETQLDAHAWYKSNSSGRTHQVGQKKSSPIGLSDMHGNVMEWVQDVGHENYAGAPLDGSAWTSGGNQEVRVVRGGAWFYDSEPSKSSYRSIFGRSVSTNEIGLRIARNP